MKRRQHTKQSGVTLCPWRAACWEAPAPSRYLRRCLAGALVCLGLSLSAVASATGLEAQRLAVEPISTGRTAVRVQFSGTPNYLAQQDESRTRVVVDIVGASLGALPRTLKEPIGLVRALLIRGAESDSGRMARITLTLTQPADVAIRVEDHSLHINLTKLAFDSGQASAGPNSTSVSPRTAPSVAVTPSPSPPRAAQGGGAPVAVLGNSVGGAASPFETDAAAAGRAATLTDVQYSHRRDAERIELAVPKEVVYSESQPRPGLSQLLLRDLALPKRLERVLDVASFRGSVARISTETVPGVGVRVNVEHDGRRQTLVERASSGALTWLFFVPGALPSSQTGVSSDGGVARRARTLHVDDSLTRGLPSLHRSQVLAGASQQGALELAATSATGIGGKGPGYAGKRIDLDARNLDIHNLLRFFSDVGKVNVVTADNVSGTVTIRVRNVPWDQALDVVLQSKGLGMVREGSIIRVAPQAELEKEREMAIARRRQELQLAPLETRLIPVSYASAEELQARARESLSGRGSVQVDGRTNMLIARDVSPNLDQIEQLVRSLDTQTPQVQVEARIVEATSRYLRDIGVQWGGDASLSAATGNPTGLSFPSSLGLTGGASDNDTPTAGLSPFQAQVQNPNFAVNLPATVGTGSGGALGLTLGSINNNFNLNVRLSAAESSGMVRILSSPRVTTIDNHEARISQGTLIPFSQVSAQGVQTTFQEAKLQLLVRPHVTADGSVAMHVKVNRDEPDFNQTSARGDPTILKREAETDLLVMDGHTAVIGGIYTRNTGRNVDQVPFFGDIPLIGLLFQKRRSSDQRGELIIFLTPRIVNRAASLGH